MARCSYLPDQFRLKFADDLDEDEDHGDHFSKLRRFNDRMIQVERAFIYSYGLPGRPLKRHVVFAPSQYNLYGSSSFPGVGDVLFNIKKTGDWEEVKRQISVAAQAVFSAVDVLAVEDTKEWELRIFKPFVSVLPQRKNSSPGSA